jgi:hypothetical protein
MLHLYMNKNIIWEAKGILLGIMKYIMKHAKTLVDTDIIIDNKRFRNILKLLFSHFTFHKNGPGFEININNTKSNGLITNNINNMASIHTNNVILLPWYDEDNPIIMFQHNPQNNQNIPEIINEIQTFGPTRLNPWSKNPTYIDFKCGMQTWDTYVEYKVLDRYCKRYGKDIRDIHRFICKALGNPCCGEIKLHPIYIPQPVSVNVGERIIEKIVQRDVTDKDIMNDATNKINLVNELLETKIINGGHHTDETINEFITDITQTAND